MKLYRVLTAFLVAVLIAGCGASKFSEEKTLLTTVTTAMETFTTAMGESETPDAITAALGAFSDQLKMVLPAIMKLNQEHPEWETDPPEELADTLDKFKNAASGLQSAMPKLMQMAGQYADDAQLQDAVKEFQSVVAGL